MVVERQVREGFLLVEFQTGFQLAEFGAEFRSADFGWRLVVVGLRLAKNRTAVFRLVKIRAEFLAAGRRTAWLKKCPLARLFDCFDFLRA